MSENKNNLGDIEGLIRSHYNRSDSGNGSVDYPKVPLVPVAPVAEQRPLPIIGGHDDHDHEPIVVSEPYIIFQYGQNEAGEGAFSMNVAGIENGITGAIGQLEETLAHLKLQVELGNISTED